MRIEIRLFATLRDRAGLEQISVELGHQATIAMLLTQLEGEFPALAPLLPSALVAVNHEYAFPGDALHDGDDVALFPPVSGGSDAHTWPEYFAITQDELDVDKIVAYIVRPETGATYVFLGAVRGITRHNDQILDTDHLVYEAYEPMAEQKLHQIAAEIRQRYPKVQGLAIVQRIGKLEVGQATVLVACSAGHRNDGCLEAAHYGIDRLKEIVPVWKKEISPNGSVWVEGHYHPTPEDIRQPIPRFHTGQQTHDRLFTWDCPECDKRYSWDSHQVHCTCGSPLEVGVTPQFNTALVDKHDTSLWRYHAMLAPPNIERITLGEGWTPLITIKALGRDIRLKLESLNPTGSFKDRGASMLVSILKNRGITRVHDDSSGNAGAALAAYAARAGLVAEVFCPESVSPHKLTQIRLYGAKLTTIAGPRGAATQAAQQAATNGESVYASHTYNPFAILAYRSIAYEVWEQLGHRAPDIIIMPVGHGSQLLGISRGFQGLLEVGAIDHLPRLIAVQAQVCAPLWHQFRHGGAPNIRVLEHPTLAEGVGIINPIRSKQVLSAITASGGEVIAVSEDEIRLGVRELAHHGILAEPTSATVWPALKQITDRQPDNATIVVSITGSGLKAPDLQDFV
jgi:threonine synthase